MLTETQRKQVEDFAMFALHVAHSLSRDDEAEGVALHALCVAVASHDPSRGSLVSRIRYSVEREVKKHTSAERDRAGRTDRAVNPDTLPAKPPDTLPVPDRLQRVARLHFVDGLSVQDIQSETGLTRRAVERAVRQIKRHVRENYW